MKMKALGNSGIEVSAVGLGCMNFGLMCDQDATTAIVDAALDAGVNFLDVAAIYGGPDGKAEALLGNDDRWVERRCSGHDRCVWLLERNRPGAG